MLGESEIRIAHKNDQVTAQFPGVSLGPRPLFCRDRSIADCGSVVWGLLFPSSVLSGVLFPELCWEHHKKSSSSTLGSLMLLVLRI